MNCPKCHFDNPEDTLFCGKCGARLSPSRKDSISTTKTLPPFLIELKRGSIFDGRYEVLEELGTGGMGKVYRVVDKKIAEEVALKLLKPEIAADKMTMERFRNEMKFARKISHKNVCRMYHFGEKGGTQYITMEYVAGEDLKSTIKRVGQLSVLKAISIAKQVCEGLVEAHNLGLVHRDLKPRNIMVDQEGNARIMDFGIARSLKTDGITTTGVMIGTPDYMSPEQAEAKEVDQRADLYSLGITLYEMVTGSVPFKGDSAFSIAFKHKTEKPPSPKEINVHIPEGLNRLILKCIEKDKEKRYQSAEELLSDLSNLEKDLPTKEIAPAERKPTALKKIAVKFSMKKVFIPTLIFLALVLCLAAIWFFTRSAKIRWAKEQAIPEIIQHIDNKNYAAAFQLAREAEKYISKNPGLTKLWSEMSRRISIQTTPSGADVYIKDERASDSEWEYLGLSPIESIKIPIGFFRWKIEKERYEIVEEVNSGSSGLLRFKLDEEGSAPIKTKIFEIEEITQDGKIIKINGGIEDRIEKGYTGRIYYGKELGKDIKRWFIAQFFVEEVNKDESRIEIVNQKEKIKQGYLVEFDKEIKGTLIIDTEPDGANIFINNDYKGNADLKLILDPAKYAVKIKTINYKEEIDDVNIKPGDVIAKTYRLAPLPLAPQLGTLKVNSKPPGAEVYFGNRKKPEGRTPFERNLLPQKYNIKIKMENYEEQIHEIDIEARKIFSQTYILAPKEGILEIDSIPQGAEVYFGESNIPEGKTPFKKSLPSGPCKIKIKKEGFEEQEDEFTINPGEAIPKIYHLNQLPSTTYTLRITTNPENATVIINNKKIEKKTPVEIELTDSQILLKIEKKNYKTVEETLNLSEPLTWEQYDLEELGKGKLIITSFKPATVEIDDKPYGEIPPRKEIELVEGPHKIKFIFEENINIEKMESIKEGEIKGVHCSDEEYNQILMQKCMYELSAYPQAELEIDGKPFGKVIPLKKIWFPKGPRKIKFTFRDEYGEYVDIEVNDLVERKRKRKVHLVSELCDFQNLESLDLPEEHLDKLENDWIIIKSSHNLEVEVDGEYRSEVTSLKEIKLQAEQRSKHKIKLIIKKSDLDYKAEINIFKIGRKRCYRIKMELL